MKQNIRPVIRWAVRVGVALGLTVMTASPSTAQQAKKPNILVIWGDDIGVHNILTCTR